MAATEITACAETLLDQASITTECYFNRAIQTIDGEFGEGYAKKNPQLLGAFIQSSAADMNGAIMAQQIRLGLQEIAQAVSGGGVGEMIGHAITEGFTELADSIGTNTGTYDEEIAAGLENIAKAITKFQA